MIENLLSWSHTLPNSTQFDRYSDANSKYDSYLRASTYLWCSFIWNLTMYHWLVSLNSKLIILCSWWWWYPCIAYSGKVLSRYVNRASVISNIITPIKIFLVRMQPNSPSLHAIILSYSFIVWKIRPSVPISSLHTAHLFNHHGICTCGLIVLL